MATITCEPTYCVETRRIAHDAAARIDRLERKVEPALEVLNGLPPRLDHMAEEIAVNKKAILDIYEWIHTKATPLLEGIVAVQEAHDRRFNEHDQRFDQIDQRLDQHDQRFDQIDQRLDQHDQRFDQIDQRFNQIDQRLDDVLKEVRGLQSQPSKRR
jgi:chromosome segregation ATPase